MLKKITIGMLLVLTLLLTACGGTSKTEVAPTVAAAAEAEETVEVVPQEAPSPIPATQEEEESAPVTATDAVCVPNAPKPTPSEEILEIFTPDPETDWIKGPETAAVTIVEYADFQCPYCPQLAPILRELQAQFPEDVRIVYRHFPLDSIHDKALLSTQAAEAAGLQDEFWAMHDLLYEKPGEWAGLSVAAFKTWVVAQAKDLGLDEEQFEADFSSDEIVAKAEATWVKGQEIGIPGTPFIMINYQQFKAQPSLDTLTAIVKLIKLEDQQFSECPSLTVDPESTYQVTLETEKGDIVIELFPDVAPLAVNSFLFLAENGWYDGTTFHRVIPDFMAQTGDPTGTGYGNPGYSFGIEIDPGLIFDRAGLVAMANSGPEANGSQFFITYGPSPDLNGGYTIFGEVIEGMDVVESLSPRDPSQGLGLPPGDALVRVISDQ